MRRVNVDRMRRHQRRGRDTMRMRVDGRWVDVPAKWDRDGSVVLGPLSSSGFPVHVSAEMVDDLVRRHGTITYPPAPSPVPRLASEQRLRRT